MAVVWVRELPQAEGAQDRTYQRFYTRNFRVLVDDRRDGPAVIRAATNGAPTPVPLIPRVGNSYHRSAAEQDTGSFVESVTPTFEKLIVGGKATWVVQVRYGPYDASTYPANPTDWPLEVVWDRVPYEEIVTEDINGDPTENSAGEPFDPPLTKNLSRTVLRITRNEAVYNPALAHEFSDKINSDSFLGADPYTVKVAGIPGVVRQNPEGGYYAAITYTFEYDPKKWKKFPLDAGYNELDSSTPPKRKRILDAKGKELSEPSKLDGSGHALAPGGTPVFLEFDVYEEINFATAFGFDFSNVPALGTF